MDVKLTPNGGSAVYLCMLPESIDYGGSEKFVTYSIISLGDVKVPRGSALEEIEWNGTFPGKTRKNEAVVKSSYWREPSEYIRLFRAWRDTGTPVNVTITGTGISQSMYVERFEGTFTGGHGDFEYKVRFIKAKTITIIGTTSGSGRTASKTASQQTSNSAQTTRTYKTKAADSLWSIAQSQLGDGTRYTEIQNLNMSKIANAGGLTALSAGIVLTIPAK